MATRADQGYGNSLVLGVRRAVREPEIRRTPMQFEMVEMKSKLKEETDRRERQRFSISAPLTLFLGDREIPAYTRDMSNRGVYFYLGLSDSKLIDYEFEFVVELPPEVTLSSCCRIRCKGRVVRKEENLPNVAGIAAEIAEYSILREFSPTI